MAFDKHQNPRDLSSSLPGIFTLKNLSTAWRTYTLVLKWPEIVGENVAKKSEPAYMLKDTLWIHVESSVLMQHLQSQKPFLLEQINKILPEGGIQDIRWEMRLARPTAERKESGGKRTWTPDRGEQETFEEMVSTVEDRQCRDALKKLWQTFYSR